jgi:hypothetical protein
MIRNGYIFRAARSATGLHLTHVRLATGLSRTTLVKVESADDLPISETRRTPGMIEARTVELLAAFYTECGIDFLSGAQPGFRVDRARRDAAVAKLERDQAKAAKSKPKGR